MNITNPDVSRYINSLYQPPSPFLAALRAAAEAEGVPVITKDAETFLRGLIQLHRPARILEIGTAVGYSALCFAAAFSGSHITTLEIREASVVKARRNIAQAGRESQIEVRQGDARELLAELKQELEAGRLAPFDMIFLDAGKGHYQAFWDGCRPLLGPAGFIVCDNVLFRAMTVSDEYLDTRRNKTIARRMRDFLAQLMAQADMDTALLPIGDGMTLSVRRCGEETKE